MPPVSRPAASVRWVPFVWLLLGIGGAALVVWAFPRVYPLLPVSWDLSAREARLIGFEAMRDLGAVASDDVVVRIRNDVQLERRLQLLAAELGVETVAASLPARWQVVWDVVLYPAGASPGEWSYRSFVAPDGEVLQVRRNDPGPAGGEIPNAELVAADATTAELRRLGAEFLLRRGVDPTELTAAEIRHDPERGTRLHYRAESAELGGRLPHGVDLDVAAGDDGAEIVGFGIWYDVPPDGDVQRVLRQRQIVGWGSVVLIYALLPLVAVPFLRQYHDGQLGLRRGLSFFGLVLAAGIAFYVINRHDLTEGANLGFLTRQQTLWFAGGFLTILVYFSQAVLALMAWSLGELLCRRYRPEKLASLDALLRLRWDNATVARSALQGTAGGVLMAGGLLALAIVGQSRGAWAMSDALYGGGLGQPLGAVAILAAGFLDVVPLFLFAVFLVPAWTANRLGTTRLGHAAAFLAAWLAVAGLAPEGVVLPLEWGWAAWTVVALVPAVLFQTVDLLAALLAGVVARVTLAAVPALFANDATTELSGWAALVVAGLPCLLSLRHLLDGDELVYHWDDVPPHVRRIAERERQRLELETAAEIQGSILPDLPPRLNGVEVASAYLPATEVGGDFYDVLALEDGRLAVAVGDVAGHGVSSGLVMSMTKSALAVQVTFDPEVAAVFRTLNRMVYQTARRRLLATLCYALVDPAAHRLTYGSAGHLYPYRVSISGEVQPLTAESYPLGVRPELPIRVRTLGLEPGDALFLLSDGLVEACPEAEDEPFGFDRLEASLRRHAGRSPEALRDAVLDDVEAHVGQCPWEDDVTVLVLRLPA